MTRHRRKQTLIMIAIPAALAAFGYLRGGSILAAVNMASTGVLLSFLYFVGSSRRKPAVPTPQDWANEFATPGAAGAAPPIVEGEFDPPPGDPPPPRSPFYSPVIGIFILAVAGMLAAFAQMFFLSSALFIGSIGCVVATVGLARNPATTSWYGWLPRPRAALLTGLALLPLFLAAAHDSFGGDVLPGRATGQTVIVPTESAFTRYRVRLEADGSNYEIDSQELFFETGPPGQEDVTIRLSGWREQFLSVEFGGATYLTDSGDWAKFELQALLFLTIGSFAVAALRKLAPDRRPRPLLAAPP